MAHCRLTLIFLLQCLFLININCDTDFHENLDEFYRPQIWSLVNYLNTHPRRTFNYNYATLINAQNKDLDSTDLTIDVEVDCRQYHPDKCITSLLECQGTVRYNTDTASYEVTSASCSPKTRVDLIRNEEPAETTPKLQTELPVEETALYETNAERQPVSEQPITKSVAPCVGCPSEINTNVEGLNLLTDTALSHIESERNNKHVVVRIIRAQRQVVAGVKYILLLEVVPTDCPKTVEEQAAQSCRLLNDYSQICEVTYYQRPWISRIKNIISNNCTSSQEFSPEQTPIPANDQDNEIDKNYYPGKPVGYSEKIENEDKTNYDSIANGNTDEMLKMTGEIIDNDRLSDLESQIVFAQPRTSTEDVESETTTEEHVTEEQLAAIEDLMTMIGDERTKRAAQNNDDDSSSSSSSSSSEEDNNDENGDDEFEKTKRKYKKYKPRKNGNNNDDNDDDSSSSSSSSSEEDNNDEKKHKNKKSKRQVESSESDESEVRQETSTAAALVAENKISSEEESSEEHRGGVRRKRSLGQTEQMIKISPEERNYVENLADFSATTLDDIDSDNHRRIVLQVLGAKKNTESTLYHLTLRVGISKCTEDDTQVTIDLHKPNRRNDNCRNRLIESLTKICKVQIKVDPDKTNPRVEKSHCQNIKKDSEDTSINRTNRSKRGGERLAGGINNVSPDDPKIVEYVSNLLKELDANDGVSDQRQLVQILSASRQIVSGTRYRLKVEFNFNNKKIICDFDVWDQPWIKDGKRVTTNCEGEEEKKYRFKRSHNHDMMLGKDDHDVHIGMFKSFMNKFDKKYPSKSEFKRRFGIFRQNMKIIKALNDNEQGTAKYGPTKFADLTKEEYKRYLGLNPALHDPNNIPMPEAQIPDVDLPVEFDWRKKGVISEVKNQGQCGSCWAFSVTGNIEGLNAIKTGNLIELSEQELVDCDTLDSGCNGGLPDNAYRAIEKLGGLETETDYPYEAENEKCQFNKTLSRVQISGAVNISSNETDMAKWLINNGPISIGINANAMQFYMGGVSHPWKFLCDPTNLDHGVLIVGFGVHKYPLFKKTLPYWLVKNSWGTSWGEQGYYRVYRGDGTCGVNMMASSAVL